MTQLSYTNAFPGGPLPQHGSGQTAVQNYRYPGAPQPRTGATPTVRYTNSFPAFSQHGSGKTTVTQFLFPGALQPIILPFMMFAP
jgi:hypothetical protein